MAESTRPRRRGEAGSRPGFRALLLLAGVVAACGAGCRGAQSPASGGKTLRIAFVPKGTTHEFWRTIHAGAVKGVRDLEAQGVKVDLVWKGPLREDDREQQVQVVESFASQGVDGIVLAPLDERALVRPVEEARRLGVPTVIVDSALASPQIVSFVATDSFKGGELAADEMGRRLDGKGRILLLRFQEGSASTTAREEGFLSRVAKHWPGLRIASQDQHAGPTRDTAKRAAENVLNRFGREIDAVFVVNETSAGGMLLALQDAGLAGKLEFIGFDGSREFVDAVRTGQMSAFVLQDPFRMAAVALTTLVDHLRGRSVPARIDTGVVVVTRENLDSPAVQEMLSPPVDRYLKPGE